MTVLLLCKDDFYVILSIESAVSAKGELFFMWNNIEDMILYEDRDIIVCHKVAGIAVQSARIGMPDMESTLKNYLASKKTGTMPYLGIVHRLDQPVEGVLVFAKNKRAAAGLTGQITSGSVTKEYLAVTDQKPCLMAEGGCSMTTILCLKTIQTIPLTPVRPAAASSDSSIWIQRSCRTRMSAKLLRWESTKTDSVL